MNLPEFNPCPELTEFLANREKTSSTPAVRGGEWWLQRFWWFDGALHIYWVILISGRKWKNNPELTKTYTIHDLEQVLRGNPKIYEAQVLYNLRDK